MRTAIISDIHGNLEALSQTLLDLQSRNVDRILCLGDLVEGGLYDAEVIEQIQSLRIPTVQGNHDVINNCCLSAGHQDWLNQLPEQIIEKDVIFTHISPRHCRQKISNPIEAWNVFNEMNQRLCFIGHLHFPILYGERCEFFAESTDYAVDAGIYPLHIDDRYVVCFGALGYPRGGGPFIRYGIYDDRNNALEFIKLQGYLLPYGT